MINLDALDSLRLGKGKGYERNETKYIRRTLRPGGFFVDVGAHIGWHTRFAADAVGPTGLVLSFEPERDNFDVLKSNVEAYPQVIIHRMAISDKIGEVMVYLCPTNSGDHRIYQVGDRKPQEMVQVSTLDEVLRDRRCPDIIKIDSQGCEVACLYGAKETLDRCRKVELILEYYPPGIISAGYKTEAFFDILRSFNFEIYIFRNSLGGILIEKVEEEWVNKALSGKGASDHMNILCRRKP